jgi:hypothetical protein
MSLEPIIFSCSGSNALNALISLGEQVGYQINVYEFFLRKTINNVPSANTGMLYRYFWLEPAKNPTYSGLSYSPYSNISNFSLSLRGDSLTTILNVHSHDLGEEKISLIPSVPPIFLNYFSSTA